MTPVIALDAMGGDRAPAEIVAGGIRAAAELDVEVLLVGRGEHVAQLGGVDPERVAQPGEQADVVDHEPGGLPRGGSPAGKCGLFARGDRPRIGLSR